MKFSRKWIDKILNYSRGIRANPAYSCSSGLLKILLPIVPRWTTNLD